MSKIYKLFERLSRFLRFLISDNYKLNNKYQNKNQVTNAELVLNLLKTKGFIPKYIIDVGCGYGQWTKKLFKYYPSSQYFLYDADKTNQKKLDILNAIYIVPGSHIFLAYLNHNNEIRKIFSNKFCSRCFFY